MRWALVLDDEQGSGYGVCIWLQANQYACSLLPGYAEAEAEIPLRQGESDAPVLLLAPVSPMGLAFLAAMVQAHPPLAIAAHTRELGRSHALVMAQNRLQMVVEIGQDGSVVGVQAGQPDLAPAPVQAVSAHPERTAPPQVQSHPTPRPLPAGAAEGQAPVELPAMGTVPRKEVLPIWITVIDDGTGCSRQLLDQLNVPAAMMTTAVSWRAAFDLATTAVSAGLLIGPMTAEAVRLCRRIMTSANGSQTVMYTDHGMTPHQAALFKECHGLQVVRKPLDLDEFRSIIERMRLPSNKTAMPDAIVSPVAPAKLRTPLPMSEPRKPTYRTPLPESSRFAYRPPPPPTSPPPTQPVTPTGSTVRLGPESQRIARPPSGEQPVSGIAAIRARKLAERSARFCTVCGAELAADAGAATVCPRCTYSGRHRKPV